MPKYNLRAVWHGMRNRCNDKKRKRYGGRGISVCKEWDDFAVFEAWAKQRYQPGLTIDRINNDGNYEPGNCRFATNKQQVRNSTCATLTEQQVAQIRGRILQGQTNLSMAGMYKVTRATIRRIQKQILWTDIPPEVIDAETIPKEMRHNNDADSWILWDGQYLYSTTTKTANMTPPKSTHGGTRAGAGKKPGPLGKKLPLTVKLSPVVLDFFETLTESRAEFIERHVMTCKEFRAWKKKLDKSE